MKWKPIFWLSGLIVGLLLLALLAIKILISPERIAAAIVPRIEAVFDREVTVGDAELTLLPPGVRISNLAIANRPPFVVRPMAQVDHIDANLQLFPLMFGRIRIKQLKIEGWEMLLIKDSTGATNFDFFRAQSMLPEHQEDAPEPLCRRFRLSDGRLLYRDDSTGTRLVLGHVRLDYDLKGERLSEISGKVEVDSVFLWSAAGNYLLFPNAASIDWRGFYSTARDSLAFRRCDWRLDKFAGRLDGSISQITKQPALNLRWLSERTELADCYDSRLIKSIPLLNGMELSGQARVDVSYLGVTGIPASRDLRGKVSISGFSGADRKRRIELKAQLLEANFNERNLSAFADGAAINSAPTTFRITIDDYKNPIYSGELSLDCDAVVAARLLNVDPRLAVSGRIQTNLSGFLKTANPEQSRIFGSIYLDRVSVADSLASWGIDTLLLDAQFTGDLAQIARAEISIGENRARVVGSITDLPLLFVPGATAQRRPFFDGTINAEFFDIDTLATLGGGSADTTDLNIDQEGLLDLNGSLQLSIDGGRFQGLRFSRLRSRLTATNRILYADSLRAEMFDGDIFGEVVIDMNNAREPDYDVELKGEEIRIESLLRDFSGFSGDLSGEANMQLSFTCRGASRAALAGSLNLRGQIDLDDGKCAALPLKTAFEYATKLQALDGNKVEDLVTQFLYADQTLRFSMLEFQSDDYEYRVDGTITRGGLVDLAVDRKLSKDDIKILQDRGDYRAWLRDKNPKNAVFRITGQHQQPEIRIESLR